MKSKKARVALQVFLIITAVVIITFGALRGEAKTVLNKAINICLECIGIG